MGGLPNGAERHPWGTGHLLQGDLGTIGTEPGEPIPALERRRLEATLGCDFSTVRLHRSRSATAACHRLGAAAFTIGNDIFLARDTCRWPAPRRLALLAHEAAHVVQQRLGAGLPQRPHTAATHAAMEAEADLGSLAVMKGGRFRVSLADASRAPACWNIAGHYYLPYLMFLNAGLDTEVAQRIALWCWLPDQVEEFDAKHIGLNWAGNLVADLPLVNKLTSPQWRNAQRVYAKYDVATYADEAQYIRAVHAGLHVFTGGNAKAEEDRRARIFGEGRHLKLLYRAIALHPYGDCFSHRRLGTQSHSLWGPILGVLPQGHMLDGEASDDIWNEGRWSQFCAYVTSLGKLANAYNRRTEGIVPLDDIVAALSPMLRGAPRVMDNANRKITRPNVVNWSKTNPRAIQLAAREVRLDEAGCSDHMRLVASQLIGARMEGGHPNHAIVPWSEYHKRYRGMITLDTGETDGEKVFYLIQKYAVGWSGMAIGVPLEPVQRGMYAASQGMRRIMRAFAQ